MALPTEEERRNWLRWLMTQQSPTSHGIGQLTLEDLEKVPGEVKDIWQSTAVEPTDDPGAFWGLIDSTLGKGSRYLREAASEAPTTVQTIPAKLASHMMGLVTDPIEKHVTGQPVTTGDIAMAGLSAIPYVGTGVKAGVGLGKEALRSWRANTPNLLEFVSGSRFLQPARSKGEAVENIMSYGPRQEQKVSFYSNAPGAPAAAMAEGAWRGTKDFMSQLFSLKDSWRWRSLRISKQKFDRIGEYFDETGRIFSNPDSWKVGKDGTSYLSTTAKDQIKKWNKIVTGDLNTMVKLAQREGIEMSDVMKQWDNIHWGEAKYIDSTKLADQLRQLPLSKNAVATKNSDLISTMINGEKGWKTEGDNFIMTQMLEKRSAGSATSPSDAQMTPAYVAIAKAYKAGARTKEDFIKYFDSLEWRPKVGRIEEGADGSVLFQYSPKRKSDFYKGGFNSVAEVKPNGTTTFWLSDEFDLGKGVVKEVMEAGMQHRLLAVHKPKTIRTPEITEAGLDKARQQMAEIITKRGEVPVSPRTTPVSGAEEVAEVATKTRTDMLGMTKEELAAMRGLTADQSIPLGYRARFYGTRYGLPAVAGGLALPEKRKREELYE